jgi:hypothetical protein
MVVYGAPTVTSSRLLCCVPEPNALMGQLREGTADAAGEAYPALDRQRCWDPGAVAAWVDQVNRAYALLDPSDLAAIAEFTVLALADREFVAGYGRGVRGGSSERGAAGGPGYPARPILSLDSARGSLAEARQLGYVAGLEFRAESSAEEDTHRSWLASQGLADRDLVDLIGSGDDLPGRDPKRALGILLELVACAGDDQSLLAWLGYTYVELLVDVNWRSLRQELIDAVASSHRFATACRSAWFDRSVPVDLQRLLGADAPPRCTEDVTEPLERRPDRPELDR